MALSNQKHREQLVCLIRGVPVRITPEERVRQSVLHYLIGPFGCPSSLIAVEVALSSILPGFPRPLPRRRLDIVCFFHHQGSLLPLLIVECKASLPQRIAHWQVQGYNFFTNAPLTAIAWPGTISFSHHTHLATYEFADGRHTPPTESHQLSYTQAQKIVLHAANFFC